MAGAFGYYRETGDFVLFEAPAVVLATGGIGKSYKVTSNSWEYTGDGHALALRAGATLINMEFLQFHPTGMVWPPSVKGILVTESVRGDGGVLKNSEGKRFMFDYVPDVFRKQYAETEEEADRWYTDPDNNRRPPELLPRDEVARAINSEVKAGRGTPAGGVFLDIASPAAGRGDPPAAAVDVPPVQGAGRRRHHGRADGGRPDLPLRDGRRRGRPGHGAAFGTCRAVRRRRGLRRHARLQPARRQLAVRPAGLRQAGGRAAAEYADRLAARPKVAVDATSRPPWRRRWRRCSGDTGENPYALQQDLQAVMDDLVGIIRREGELEDALIRLAELRERVAKVERGRRPTLQPGLAPGPRPAQHAGRLGVHREGGAGAARSPAAATPARTSRRWSPSGARSTWSARWTATPCGWSTSRCRRCGPS